MATLKDGFDAMADRARNAMARWGGSSMPGVEVSEAPMSEADAKTFGRKGPVGPSTSRWAGSPHPVPTLEELRAANAGAQPSTSGLRSPEARAWEAGRAPVPPAAPEVATAPKTSILQRGAGMVSKIGSGAEDVVGAVKNVARPFVSAGRTVLGAAARVAPAALAGDAAAAGLRTDTEDYAKRFGMEGTEPGLARDLGIRALGVASDVGNALTFHQADRFFQDKQNPQLPAPLSLRNPADPVGTPGAAGAPQTSFEDNFPLQAQPAAPGTVTRVGNTYSGTDVAGTPVINGQEGLRGGMVGGSGDGTFKYGGGSSDNSAALYEARKAAIDRGDVDAVAASYGGNFAGGQANAGGLRGQLERQLAGKPLTRRGADVVANLAQVDATREGNAVRAQVDLRGQDINREGHFITAKTAANAARIQQMQQDRQYNLDREKFGHDVAKTNFDQREKAQKDVHEEIAGMLPPGADGKPDTATAARYAIGLNGALANFQAALEQRAATGDTAAAAQLKEVREKGIAALDAKDKRAFVNAMKIKDLSDATATGRLNPFGGTGTLTDAPPAGLRKTSEGILGFGGEYSLIGPDGKPTGATVPARHVEGDGSFIGGKKRTDLREFITR